jgi:Na+/H+-dicarboxylate symporter
MAGSVSHHGLNVLGSYAKLVASLYGALVLFALLVLMPALLIARANIRLFVRKVREPFLLAFSTASSEAALPRALEKMVEFGVPESVAGFVIPAGYSFNLDGSTLYISLAALTIAQAAHIHMPLSTELLMMLTFVLTSKGVAGVPRASLVIIAAGCASFGLPGEAGVAMILAVDELMDMARTSINVTGNCVASVVVARWEGVLGAPLRVRDEDSPGEEIAQKAAK